MDLLRFYFHSLVALGVPMIVIALLYHVIRLFPVFPKYGWKIILIFLAYLATSKHDDRGNVPFSCSILFASHIFEYYLES